VGLLVMACGVISFGNGGQSPNLPSPFGQSNPSNPFNPPNQSNQPNPVTGGNLPVAATPILANPAPPSDVAGLQGAFEDVYAKVNPSIVTIEIGTRAAQNNGQPGFGFGQGGGNGQGGNGQQIVPTALGSGVIWDGAGHIITNNHVVQGEASITVTFWDGSSYAGKLVGTDPNADLAVIQVADAPASLIKPITVGDSSQVKVGEMVVAIGNPFGLSNTMTTGIVSAIGRSISASVDNSQNPNAQSNAPTFSIPDVIQTDAAINPGNSGGALVNMGGALIGVPSQIESQSGGNTGVGFAIPSNIVVKVAQQIISTGKAAHSYLGISGVTITPDVASALGLKNGQQGILVASVVQGGPAAQAGIQAAQVDQNGNPTSAGDIITGIDGVKINRFEDMVSYLYAKTQPGQKVTLTVLRNGQETQVPITLGTQPSQ
jgi:S1-C subfamily serine protease